MPVRHITTSRLSFSPQANGTLQCSDVLAVWEPVRVAAGLTPAVMSAWCSVSVQPAIDAYNEAWATTWHPNMSVSGRKSVAEMSSGGRLTWSRTHSRLLI